MYHALYIMPLHAEGGLHLLAPGSPLPPNSDGSTSSTSPMAGPGRGAGGMPTSSAGLLLVSFEGTWGSVCGRAWGMAEAAVACRWVWGGVVGEAYVDGVYG